jgi:predicted Fe-Mo cluster-binding NifX family protein
MRPPTASVFHARMRYAPNAEKVWYGNRCHTLPILKTRDMKVAITSTGGSLESKLDQRFGRCSYFIIYDTETQGIEFLPNPNKEVQEGAGPASVQLVASRNVQKIISGEFGIKIKPLLDSLKIQMIVMKNPEKSIREIIKIINN